MIRYKVDELSKKFNINPTNKNTSSSISDSIKNIENNIEKILMFKKIQMKKLKKLTIIVLFHKIEFYTFT